MFNRRLVCELYNPYPWAQGKLYKVKVLRQWHKDSRRWYFIDVSFCGADHPRFKQRLKAIYGRRKKHV